MGQKLKTVDRPVRIIMAAEMEMGQLAQMTTPAFEGIVVVKTYDGIIALTGNENNPPFQTTWINRCTLPVRILEPNEVVELWND